MPIPITAKKLLAVEGKDEVNFFKKLLEHLNIEDVQIINVGGKDNFKNRFPILAKASGFSEIAILGVIRDAETNSSGTFDSVKNVLAKVELNPPSHPNIFTDATPSIGVFIMPDNASPGMLEDLCLQTVSQHPAMACVNDFINCCDKKLETPPKNPSKAKVQAYLAAMPEIANSAGIGAKKNYWDFNSNVMDELKTFLSHLQ